MRRTALALAASVSTLPLPALAMDNVVVSIKPLHSLVAGVMDGVGEPQLLIKGAASPHSYALRPSEASLLQDAALVFWIGDTMETFLTDPLLALSQQATVLALEDADGLTLLDYREGGAFEEQDRADADAAEHEHEDAHHDHDHDHAAEHHDGAGEHHHDEGGDHAGHDHAGHDLHIWLDPENAKAMVGAIEETLAAADPANAQTYATNASAMTQRIEALSSEIETQLAPLAGRPFVVFHDAYHYFENSFGLEAAGSITVSPEIEPGARRIGEIQETVRTLDAACVFSEPQFEPRIVEVVAEGSNAASGVLDPLGATIEDGPELYFELMRNMASSFQTCLAAKD
ncbi:zinc ABC transporter substrate-binding protein ZnuA [Pararhizobium haloflavum]|uniref:zinc ABC transporter substrate-binding protein ZnuA n=1 Tax=Pararhizobium haloflavum TaxID=2037914 RepID=UPI000C1A0BDA|nr:zinc ABC transporter substrate-binding protein ZnuA [Pararhizobium haloflavum]